MKKITKYWLKYYLANDHCSLCGNRGVIDTTGIRTRAGVEVGRKNYCICPNGQSMRNQEEGSMNLTDDEIEKLKEAKNDKEWNSTVDEILEVRDGVYPPDWAVRAMLLRNYKGEEV